MWRKNSEGIKEDRNGEKQMKGKAKDFLMLQFSRM